MLKIKLICVGSLQESYFRDAMAEYKKRLGGYCSFEEIRLKEAPMGRAASGGVPSAGDIAAALDREAEDILSKIPKRAYTVALCIEGKMMSSEALAEAIDRQTTAGVSEICFIIGSSHGLSDRVKSAADLRFSMSPLTFPHQLASVMLSEALYRALDILRGGKYHK